MVKHKGMNRQGMVRLLAAGIMAGTLIVLVTTNSGAAKKKSITFTMANYGQLSNSPNDYKGAHVNISGKVFSLPPTGTKGISAVQMWMDAQNSNWNTLVVYRTTQLRPQVGDYLLVIGIGRGSYSYKNGFGASDSAVEIGASSVTERDEAATEPPISSTGVTLSTCALDPNLNTLVDVTGSIVNPSSVTYNYDISIAVISGGLGWVRLKTSRVPWRPINPRRGRHHPTLLAAMAP